MNQAILDDDIMLSSILSDNHFTKRADGLLDSFLGAVKNYFKNSIDPNNKVKSVFNLLAPTGVSLILKGFGFGKIGLLFQMASLVFKIDIYSIFEKIKNKLFDIFSSKGHVTESDINSTVESTLSGNTPTDSTIDVGALKDLLLKKSSESDLRIIKLALLEFDNNEKMVKRASYLAAILPILYKVIRWIFYIGLGAAGIVGAKKVYDYAKEKVFNKKEDSEIDTNKFKLNTSYHNENYNESSNTWLENYKNNKSSIEKMIIDFTNQVYPETKGLDFKIKNTVGFAKVVEIIEDANALNENGRFVLIPIKLFKSKKDIVDLFINDINK